MTGRGDWLNVKVGIAALDDGTFTIVTNVAGVLTRSTASWPTEEQAHAAATALAEFVRAALSALGLPHLDAADLN